MTCTYCNSAIDETDAGWGYMQDGLDRTYYHVECIEVNEGITL